ncbi:MAG TPA: SRPBCC family protein [Verrucomicrobiae bacterium]|jgi:uncharacterized membrane protein|nr:SRPBCC family protein [Verrucomicrobiae bacterium]
MDSERPSKKNSPGDPNVPVDFSDILKKTVVIRRPVSEVYAYWRDLEHLPGLMPYLNLVQELDRRRSRWRTEGPAGDVEWTAEITNDIENKLISWRTLDGSDIEHAGSVQFTPVPESRTTEVLVTFAYNPPAGKAGKLAAKILRKDPEKEIEDALDRFKGMLEAGPDAEMAA